MKSMNRQSMNDRLFLLGGRFLLSVSITCLIAGLLTTASLAQDKSSHGGKGIPPGMILPFRIENEFDVEKGQKNLKIGRNGQAKREYAMERTRTGKRLDLSLKRKGGTLRELKFGYDEEQGQIAIVIGGTSLQIEIDDNQDEVSVGGYSCHNSDWDCIARAVKLQLSDLSAEEVAALEAGLADELDGMKNGNDIRTVMNLLTGKLALGESDL